MSLFGLLDFFGNLATTDAQIHSAERQQENEFSQQQSLLNMQNDYNTEMWLRSNQYNSPANQMQRLIDAGINADAAAQSVAGGNGNFTSPVQSSLTPSVNSGIASIVDAFNGLHSDFITREFQRENLRSQTEGLDIDNSIKPIKNAREERYVASLIEKSAHENDLSDAQTKQILELLPYYKNKTQAEIDMTNNLVLKLQSEVDKIRKEIQLDDVQISKILSDVKLNEAEVDKLASDIAVNYAKVSETEASTLLIGKQTETEAIKAQITRLQQLGEEFKQSLSTSASLSLTSERIFEI